jgi:hypothetical protein
MAEDVARTNDPWPDLGSLGSEPRMADVLREEVQHLMTS